MCIVSSTDRHIVFRERQRTARFSNELRKKFDVCQVDGCLIVGDTPRCDGMLRSDDCVWLIELKGVNIERAVEQIVSTSTSIPGEIKDRRIIPVIVASKCPAISGQQKVLRRLKQLRGNYNGEVVLRTRVARIDVEHT